MIVDIGGGTTETAVISMAGLVTSESIRIGGDEFDQCIIRYLKNEYNVLVGENTAEQNQIQIGNALLDEEDVQRLVIRGRNVQTGYAKELEINSLEITEAIREPVFGIINGIKSVLERTQPELAADLLERGICMAGGASLLRGLPEIMAWKPACRWDWLKIR